MAFRALSNRFAPFKAAMIPTRPHVAATPVGLLVTATAAVLCVAGRTITFRVEARDQVEAIGSGHPSACGRSVARKKGSPCHFGRYNLRCLCYTQSKRQVRVQGVTFNPLLTEAAG